MGRILRARPVWALLAASAALFYVPLARHALWDPGEACLAEIAREMVELKSWLVPSLNYAPFLEKPPLMLWVTAASFRLFGVTEFAARTGAAAFGVLAVWATYRLGKNWKDKRVGLLAGAILATSTGFFALTQYLTFEIAFTFWMILIWGAAAGLLVERSLSRARRLTYVLALAAAGGVLTQGVLAIVWPLAAWLTVFLGQGRRLPQPRLPWKGAFLVAALIAAPWFIAMMLQHPLFPFAFWIEAPLKAMDAAVPIYLVLPILLAGFLPWTVFLPKVVRNWTGHRWAALKRDPEGALMVAGVGWGIVLFSLSPDRSIGSFLPLTPLLALLLANEFEGASMPVWLGRGIAALIGLFLPILLILKCPPETLGIGSGAWKAFLTQSDVLALALGLGVFVLVGVWGMRQTLICVGGICVVQALVMGALYSLAPDLDAYFSTRSLAERFKSRAAFGEKIVAYGFPSERAVQSLSFYLERQVPAIPHLATAEENAAAIAAMAPGTWGVTDLDHWLGLRTMNVFEPVATSGNKVLFRKVSGS